MSHPQYGLGALPSPMDLRDFKVGSFLDMASLPAVPAGFLQPCYTSYDYIPRYNQYNTMKCGAFTMRQVQETNQFIETGKFLELSEDWLYANREPDMHQGEGTVGRQLMSMTAKEGTCPRANFNGAGKTYAECKAALDKIKATLLPKALPNRTYAYVSVTTPLEMKLALMYLGPLAIAISTPSSFYNTPSTGLVAPPSGTVDGGHMMFCPGFEQEKYLSIVNTWGPEWGREGMCFMPMNWANIKEVWAITDLRRLELMAYTPARLIDNTFLAPARTLFESIGGIVNPLPRDANGKLGMEAVIPPNINTRRISLREGSKIVTVEVI